MTLLAKLKVKWELASQKVRRELSHILVGNISNEYAFTDAETDIRILADAKSLARYERERSLLISSIIKKYEENYCPFSCYKSFSEEEDQRYLSLRIQIDEILSKLGHIPYNRKLMRH